MPISKETVEYIAHLGRIDLKPEELAKLAGQLQDILGFIDKLKELDVTNVKPTSHILPVNNIFRNDEAHPGLTVERTLENAPQKQGNFFAVPKVIE